MRLRLLELACSGWPGTSDEAKLGGCVLRWQHRSNMQHSQLSDVFSVPSWRYGLINIILKLDQEVFII